MPQLDVEILFALWGLGFGLSLFRASKLTGQGSCGKTFFVCFLACSFEICAGLMKIEFRSRKGCGEDFGWCKGFWSSLSGWPYYNRRPNGLYY